MTGKTLSAVVVATVLAASPAAADSHASGGGETSAPTETTVAEEPNSSGSGHRFYVGGFAGYNFLDDELELGNSFFNDQVPESAILVGLRLGYDIIRLMPDSALAPVLSVELESKMAFSDVEGSPDNDREDSFAPVIGWRAHAMASFLTNMNAQPFLVVGFGGETVVTGSDFIDSPDTDAAFHWGAGVRYMLNPSLSARLDFRQVITAGRFDFLSLNHEVHVGIGYHFELFGGQQAPPPPAEPTDSDGDGLLDPQDTCPDKPEDKDGFEDQDGCPDLDNDGDNIPDADDKCPDEAESPNGVDDTDGCPETDEDLDGLVGSKDNCPQDPEDKDGFQDDDGCPDKDNDGDGIADTTDKCPGAPETVNGYQDADGCPDTLPDAIKKFNGTIKGIRFASGSSRIVRSSNRVLNAAVKTLKEYPKIRIEISGHTDNTGTRMRNVVLSRARAMAVKKYLVKKGVAPDRVDTNGYGPDQPIADNKSRKGRAQNRRIEFKLVANPTVRVPGPGASKPATGGPSGKPVPAVRAPIKSRAISKPAKAGKATKTPAKN